MENKVAIITGGANGIGKSTAKLFADKGAKVIVSDIAIEEGKDLVKSIKNDGGEASFKKCDVRKESDIKSLIDFAVKTYGRLDFAVNNAGTEGKRQDTVNCTNENWNFVMDINLTGVWKSMKYEIPKMLKNENGGAIVNISSIAGLVGFDDIPAYVASKHGVVGITKATSLEYSAKGVRVNAVCPGVIETEMIERSFEEAPGMKEQLLKQKPIGRLGQPEEIAEVIVWLCSDSSSYVTGEALAADGGYVSK